MAASKAKVAPAAPAVAKGKEVVSWKEKLAAETQRTLEREKPSSAKSVKFNAAGVVVDGVNQPGGTKDYVVLESMEANTFYENDFDPDSPEPPKCYAFGGFDEGDEPSPHPDVEGPVHDSCKGCPNNEWGSAAKGKGKACKNSRWLAVIAADDLDDIASAEIRIAKLPVMSVRNWNAYAREIATDHELPPFAVITRFGSVPDPKSQYRATFAFVDHVDMEDAVFEALTAKRKVARDLLVVPFAPQEARVEMPKNGKLSKGKVTGNGRR